MVAAELAAAYATARMLAVLPLGVLLLGSGIGGDPVGFLTGSIPGLVCLALGLALSFAGLQWLAERPVGLDAAITVFRDEIEGYDLCNGEPCTRSVTEWRPVASVRLLYRLGGR